VRGSRSTVGTLTELYDFLRLLYAKIATPFCPVCGREIRKWDPSQVAEELIEKFSGKKAFILFVTKDSVDDMRRQGFRRLWINGEARDIDEMEKGGRGAHETSSPHGRDAALNVVLDRLVIRDEPRLSDSIETAWKQGRGKVRVIVLDEGNLPADHVFTSENACDDCGIHLPEPTSILFSFNHPVGACPECKGFGDTLQYDEDLLVPDRGLSLAKGAVDPWNKPAYRWWKKQLKEKAKRSGLDIHKPYAELSPDEKALLFKGGEGFYGINDFFEDMENRRYKLHVRVFLSRYRRSVTCKACGGKRLKKDALAYKVSGLDIAELCRMPVAELLRFFGQIELSPFKRDTARELLRQLTMKLEFLQRVGLDYLTLDRFGKTLSGGEYQRINLSNQLASLLTGTLYVLDEPTVGLHARDTDRIAKILHQLADLGNTIIVVEHDRSMIGSSDWIVELGPGGGHRGGSLVFSGKAEEFLITDTLTSRYIRNLERVDMPGRTRAFSGQTLTLSGARGNNLKKVDLRIPLKRLVAVTGVSGSGKSSLIVETLYRALARHFRTENEPSLPYLAMEGEGHLKGVKLIDQSPIGRSPRSNPVTYLKVFDPIRKLFADQKEAKAYGYSPGFFSFNVPGGRCEACRGGGLELMEMYFFEDLYVTCEKCGGKRYRQEALRVTYKHKNIHDVLGMTIEEAMEVFYDQHAIRAKLSLMIETGLGYLRLGQPATTLSGGEAQRLKICSEMGATSKGEYLYILDEPTVGLHFSDVKAVLNILNRLVETGNTVVVIEHNLDLVKAADWIIDLGPEGGDRGGMIIFEGTPGEIVEAEGSYTGKFLRQGMQ
jgi:excinuclease ABC subunit A